MFYYNQRNYSSIKYPSKNHPNATIASSGCGVCSSCMVINNLAGKELYSVNDMRNISIKCGARVAEGTDVYKLLKEICKRNKNFKFHVSNNVKDVVKALKSGAMCIANQGNKYNVFSNSGHFVVLSGMDENNIKVLDPYMYSGKYETKTRKKRIISSNSKGCIVDINNLSKACVDRDPSYYIVTYTKPLEQKKEDKKTVSSSQKPKKPSFKIYNVYTLIYNMKVRETPGGAQKKRKQLTINAKLHSVNDTMAILKARTKVTVIDIKEKDDKIWVLIPSGWIAAYDIKDKKYYIK